MKRHVFSFRGGPLSGLTLDTASPDCGFHAIEYHRYLFLRGDCASGGDSFEGMTADDLLDTREEIMKAAARSDLPDYVIGERDESPDCVRLTLEYSPARPSKPSN